MSLTRNDNWTDNESKTAKIGLAFSSEVRVRMLTMLLNESFLTATELCKLLNRSQTTIANHIKFLNNAGLINKDYEFHQILISINEENKAYLSTMIN